VYNKHLLFNMDGMNIKEMWSIFWYWRTSKLFCSSIYKKSLHTHVYTKYARFDRA